jgi:IS30 family transposase
MVLASTSAAGIRYLLSVREGRGLKGSARESALAWKPDTDGCGTAIRGIAAREGRSLRLARCWVRVVAGGSLGSGCGGSDRHHLRVDVEAEVRFWAAYDAGAGVMHQFWLLGLAVRPATGGLIADSVSCEPLE